MPTTYVTRAWRSAVADLQAIGGLGGQVFRGEKGTSIQYWKFTDEQLKKDDQGKPVLDEEGKPVKVMVKLERPRVF